MIPTDKDPTEMVFNQAFTEKWQHDMLELGVSVAIIETLTIVRTSGAAAAQAADAARKESESVKNDFKKWRDEISAEYGKLFQAFPDGDLELHRKSHEVLNLRKEFWQKMCNIALENAVKGGTWALLVGIALACWEFFKLRVKD